MLYESPFNLEGIDGQYNVEFYGVDYLGNQEETNSELYNLDNTAPTTTHVLIGNIGDNSWFDSYVTVELSSSDGSGSGVLAIYYSRNAGPITEYLGPIQIALEGVHVLEYWAMDNLGLTEMPSKSTGFKIDTIAPVTTATLTPSIPDGLAEWYVSPVDVTLSFTDVTS